MGSLMKFYCFAAKIMIENDVFKGIHHIRRSEGNSEVLAQLVRSGDGGCINYLKDANKNIF